MTERPLHAAVERAVAAAILRGVVDEEKAREWWNPICRSDAEREQAMELFRRWSQPPAAEQEANG